jgi:hypothetical protein
VKKGNDFLWLSMLIRFSRFWSSRSRMLERNMHCSPRINLSSGLYQSFQSFLCSGNRWSDAAGCKNAEFPDGKNSRAVRARTENW